MAESTDINDTGAVDDETLTSESGTYPYRLLSGSGDVLSGSAQDPRVRLQSLLAQWLRMENVVVLMGAGASVGHGGPLLGGLARDVLKTARDLCAHDTTLAKARDVIEKGLEDASSGHPSYNFEKWLTYLTNAHCIASSPDSPLSRLIFRGDISIEADALSHLITTLSRLIFLRCSLRLPALLENVVGHHAFFAKLVARDPGLGRAHIFTTNYDTLIEQALEDLGIHYADGFVGRVRACFTPASYGLDIYYPGDVAEGRVRRFDKFVHLYKPHGSITWRRTSSGAIMQVADPYFADWTSWSAQPAVTLCSDLTDRFKQDGDPIGIIPTESKFVQTLGMPYAHLFRALHTHLQVPQTFVLISGYSFGDPHVNAIIDDAMANPSLVMLVVDPYPSNTLRERIAIYQRAGERVFLLCPADEANPKAHCTFDDFSLNVMPHVKWIDDYVKLRRVEKEVGAVSISVLDMNGDE